MTYLITFIDQNEKQIESGHDRSAHVYILLQWFSSVIASRYGVRRCQDRRSGVKGRLQK